MIKDIIESNRNIDAVELKLNKLKELFPGAFHGDIVDLEYIRNQLKNTKVNKEGYELNFLGKSYAKLLAALETETVIVPNTSHNLKKENINSENLYISADNIEALKHLLKSYWRSSKMIYIDPPYNTGSDGFIYKDSFGFTSTNLIEKLGLSEEEANRTIEMINSESSSHSAWLTFMYPRLYLARDLLDSNGVIFVSIDENELSNLKLLMDDVFGENNFIALLTVENNPKGRKNSKYISISNDYCLVYARNKEEEQSYFVENVPKNIDDLDEDEDGNFVHNSGKRVLVGENSFNNILSDFDSPKNYSVYYNPTTKKVVIEKESSVLDENTKLTNLGYERYISYLGQTLVENTYTQDRFIELFNTNSLEFKNNKIYEKNMSTTIRLKSILSNREYAGVVNGVESKVKFDFKTTSAGTYLKKMFDDKKVFSNPKPTGLIETFLTLIDDKDALIIDFFGGSATTADAILRLNRADGGNRKFILVQLPEDLDQALLNVSGADAKKTIENAIEVCDLINKPHTLDYVGMERINRVLKELNENEDIFSTGGKIGYKHFIVENVKNNVLLELERFNPNTIFSDRGVLDEFGVDTIISTWQNRDGYGLSKTHEEIIIDNYSIFKQETTIYLINPHISDEIIKTLLEKFDDDNFNCNKIVIFGYSFTMSEIQSIKDNFKQIEGIKHIVLDIEVRY